MLTIFNRATRSVTPRSELLSEPLGRPHRPLPLRPQLPGRPERAREPARERPAQGPAREQRLVRGLVAVGSDRFPFILVVDKLNCGKTHCLECIKDVALDVEEHSREYEPWD